MNIGANIKQLRKLKGISQQKLADKVNIHISNIARYETNVQNPSVEILHKIADFFNVSLDYFVSKDSTTPFDKNSLDEKLLSKFKQLENFDEEEKRIVIELIDAFIAKKQIKSIIK